MKPRLLNLNAFVTMLRQICKCCITSFLHNEITKSPQQIETIDKATLIWSNLCLKGFEEELHEHDVVLCSVLRHAPHPEGPGGGLLGHQGEGDVRLHCLHDASLGTRLQHLSRLLGGARAVLISKNNLMSEY